MPENESIPFSEVSSSSGLLMPNHCSTSHKKSILSLCENFPYYHWQANETDEGCKLYELVETSLEGYATAFSKTR